LGLFQICLHCTEFAERCFIATQFVIADGAFLIDENRCTSPISRARSAP